jgi:hypothetical protein
MRQSPYADNESHLRRLTAALPSPLEDTAVRLSPRSRQLLWAYWDADECNHALARWVWRLFYVVCIETAILFGLGITWAVKNW